MSSNNLKKRLAIVHNVMVTGGAEKALINMLHYIDYSKYEVTLWLKNDTGAMQNQIDSRVEIRYWGNYLNNKYSKIFISCLKRKKFISLIYSIFCRVLSRMFVKNWHKNFKYHVMSLLPLSDECYDAAISYHSLVKEDVMILSYAIKAHLKIGWIHGACNHDFNNVYFESFPIEYKKMDYIFCVSNSVKDIFINKYPYLSNKIRVMYNLQNFQEIISLSNQYIEIPFDKMIFVTVGRLSREKGQDMIPYIAKHLIEKKYDFIWYLVGDGNLRNELEIAIRNLNLEKNIILLGNQANPYPYIARSTIYIQPSYTEGFCTTTFEAKILNRFIIVTDVPGMREQFRSGEAIICQPNIDSLCKCIIYSIDNELYKQVKNNVFSEQYNYNEIMKLYDLIDDKNG